MKRNYLKSQGDDNQWKSGLLYLGGTSCV